jgi:hypothetical protein
VASTPSDTSRGPRTVLGLVTLAVVTSAAVWVWAFRGPAVTEGKVRSMLVSGELVGLPVEEAARRLGHRVGKVSDEDLVLLDFEHVPGWSAAGVMLTTRGGKVTSASWAPSVTSRTGDDPTTPSVVK